MKMKSNKTIISAMISTMLISVGSFYTFSPPAEAKTTSESNTVTYQTIAILNMRSGASTKYKVVKVLPKNAKVTYIKKSGSWYQVKYGSKTGWVSKNYLKKVTPITRTTINFKSKMTLSQAKEFLKNNGFTQGTNSNTFIKEHSQGDYAVKITSDSAVANSNLEFDVLNYSTAKNRLSKGGTGDKKFFGTIVSNAQNATKNYFELMYGENSSGATSAYNGFFKYINGHISEKHYTTVSLNGHKVIFDASSLDYGYLYLVKVLN